VDAHENGRGPTRERVNAWVAAGAPADRSPEGGVAEPTIRGLFEVLEEESRRPRAAVAREVTPVVQRLRRIVVMVGTEEQQRRGCVMLWVNRRAPAFRSRRPSAARRCDARATESEDGGYVMTGRSRDHPRRKRGFLPHCSRRTVKVARHLVFRS